MVKRVYDRLQPHALHEAHWPIHPCPVEFTRFLFNPVPGDRISQRPDCGFQQETQIVPPELDVSSRAQNVLAAVKDMSAFESTEVIEHGMPSNRTVGNKLLAGNGFAP